MLALSFHFPRDLVGITFLMTAGAMLGAAGFFAFEQARSAPGWRRPLRVAGAITLIAGLNYLYMSQVWTWSYQPLTGAGETPTSVRYFDWLLTVPLLCSQFYSLLRAGAVSPHLSSPLPGATPVRRDILWRLVGGGLFMLMCGWIGEHWDRVHNPFWGALGVAGWFLVLWEVYFGPARQLVQRREDVECRRAFDLLCGFCTVGWLIYPIGYMTQPGNLLAGLNVDMNLIYNVGDPLNKIGSGLAIWTVAKAAPSRPVDLVGAMRAGKG